MGKIIDKLFRGTLLVFIISMLTTTLGTLIDGMIISKFLGGVSIAGMGIGNAYGNLITALSGIIAAGTQNIFSGKLGKGQMEEADGLLSLSVVILMVVSLATIGMSIVFLKPIAAFFGAGDGVPEVRKAAMDYILGYAIGLPAVFGMAVMTPIMQLDSDRKRAVYAVTALSITNVAGDLVNIFIIRGGIFWIGVTTSISYYVGAGILLLHFFHPDSSIRLDFKHIRFRETARIFYDGAPAAFNKFGTMFRNTLFNNISALAAGTVGLAANSIICNLAAMLSCFPKGFGSSTLTIGGMLHGEEDRTGLKNMLLSAFRATSLISGAVMVILLVFARYIALIYASPEAEQYAMVITGIRWYGLSMIPYSLSTIMINYYHSIRRIHLANLLSTADNFLFMAASVLVLFRLIGMNAIWVAYFSGKVLTLIAIYIGVSIHNRHPAWKLDDFLLLGRDYDVPEEDKIDIAISTMEEVISLSKRAEAFCMDHGIDRKKSSVARLCIEEMVGNVITHGFDDRSDRYVDVRIICKNEAVTVRIRDNCRKFNVKERYALINPNNRSTHLGLCMTMGMVRDVKYMNTLKLNCLIIQV